MVEFCSLPGFDLLPPAEQDYLIEIVVAREHRNAIDFYAYTDIITIYDFS